MKKRTHAHIIASKTISILGALSLAFGILFFGMQYAVAEITTQLDRGDSGSDVTELQSIRATNPNIYPSGLVTGYFGPLTQEAVENFQESQGIVSSGTPETTGYGRVGPVTMSHLNALLGGGAVGGSADVDAPVINPNSASIVTDDTVSTGDTWAAFSWTTNEDAQHRVMYSTSWPFVYNTAASVGDDVAFSTAPGITITNLQPNTQYYYVLESVDVAGNVSWTTPHTFTTE